MSMAHTVKQYLDDRHIAYDVMTHKRTSTSLRSAEAGDVSGDCMAKGVVLKCREGYILAVIPASRHVSWSELADWPHRPLGLASEEEIAWLFPDCDLGAIPVVGAPYGLETVVDESLESGKDIYFEAGDHESLIHLSGAGFHQLMEAVPHRRFSV